MGTAGLIESFELRQLNLVILSAAYSDINAGIISHEIMSALSSCIFMARQPGKACLVFFTPMRIFKCEGMSSVYRVL